MALNKQMELFEDGGLMDEGGTVDKMSGNDVPTGSTQEEVRDDIPANLSEGEFVLPADVVRYHGLEKIMSLRDEAKAGLQKMDDMGQMGNSEEATLPDDMPFSIDDLDMEDDGIPDFQVGGYVAPTFNQGQLQQSQFANYTPQYTPYQAPDYTNQATGYQPPQQAATPMASSAIPSFSSFVTPTYVAYVNEAGNTIQIPVDANGNPLIPVPAGFTAQGEQPTTPTTTPMTTPTSSFNVPKPYDEGQGSRDDAAATTPLTGEALEIDNLTKTSAFKDINNLLDTRTGMEKFGDTVESIFAKTLVGRVLGAGGTTSQEYATAKKDLAKDIINYSSDPVEQEKIMTEVKTQLEFAEANPKTPAEIAATPVIQGFERYTDGRAKSDADGNRVGQKVETTPITDITKTAITDIANKNQLDMEKEAGPRVSTTQVREAEAGKSLLDVETLTATLAENLDRVGLNFDTPTGKKTTLNYLNAVIDQEATVNQVPNAKEGIKYTPETDSTSRDNHIAAAIALKEQLLKEEKEAKKTAEKARNAAEKANQDRQMRAAFANVADSSGDGAGGSMDTSFDTSGGEDSGDVGGGPSGPTGSQSEVDDFESDLS